MNDQVIANINYYSEKSAKHGIGPEALGYTSTDNQEKRFEALMHGIKTQNSSLLDVGCGYADLLPMIENSRRDWRDCLRVFTGIDIMQNFIATGIKRHIGEQWSPTIVNIMVHDLLDEDAPDPMKHDIVVLSGVLNLEVPNWVDHTEKMLDKAWSLTEEVLCFNISDAQGVPANERTPGQIQVLYPDRWEAWVMECGVSYLKISGYLPYDTTFQVFR